MVTFILMAGGLIHLPCQSITAIKDTKKGVEVTYNVADNTAEKALVLGISLVMRDEVEKCLKNL